MQDAQPQLRRSGMRWRPTLRTRWYRLLDGAHRWGFFDAMVGRYGHRRYRLVVFPPGISATDRRLLRLWRGWPVGGGLVGMLAIMLIAEAADYTQVTLLVTAAYVGVGAVLFALTAEARSGVRSMSLVLLDGDLRPHERRRYDDWNKLVLVLTGADRLLKAGAIDPTQHEALWWQAYDRLEVHAGV